jgi:hypothetical protein
LEGRGCHFGPREAAFGLTGRGVNGPVGAKLRAAGPGGRSWAAVVLVWRAEQAGLGCLARKGGRNGRLG